MHVMVGHRSTLQSRVTVAVGYGGLPLCLDRFQAGRLGYKKKMILTGVNPSKLCPVKCREVTVKKKRVETFRNIRYVRPRIVHTDKRAIAVLGGHTVDFNCVEKLRVPDRGAPRVGDRARRARAYLASFPGHFLRGGGKNGLVQSVRACVRY